MNYSQKVLFDNWIKNCPIKNVFVDDPVSKVKMNLDGLLAPDIPNPLPKKSGFNMVINGPSGSGKTNILINILHRRAKEGKRQSLRRVFDAVVIVSPTLKSLGNNIFEDLEDKKKFTKFDDTMLDGLEEILEEMKTKREEEEDNFFTLLILDDVGSQLKKNRKVEARFASLLQNRRHLGGGGLSVIVTGLTVIVAATPGKPDGL